MSRCPVRDQLIGSSAAFLNLEVRAPIPGIFSGRLRYGSIVPVEAIAFADIGYLWTPNWDLALDGQDVENYYVRRSFDGGQSFTATAAHGGSVTTVWR